MSIKKMSESTLTDSGRYSDMSMGEVGWGAATGGTEVTNAGYKYHTFTSDGTLTVTQGGKFDCLIVAGAAVVVPALPMGVELEVSLPPVRFLRLARLV